MVDWAVAAARSVADGIVLVLPPDDEHVAQGDTRGADAVVGGGDTRSQSVRAGLGAVPEDADVIVVHDGARPLTGRTLFASVVNEVRRGAQAAIPVTTISDTLKRVVDGKVLESIARDSVVAVQTPQAFRADVLRRAHAAGGDATDDSSLVEALGVEVRVVPGDEHNFKVTTPSDLELVQMLAGV